MPFDIRLIHLLYNWRVLEILHYLLKHKPEKWQKDNARESDLPSRKIPTRHIFHLLASILHGSESQIITCRGQSLEDNLHRLS